MKKLGKLILIFLLVIIIIIILILLLSKLNNKTYEDNELIYDGAENIQESDKDGYVEVSDYSIYNSIDDILNKYVNIMSNTEVQDIEKEEIINDSQNMSIVYNLLDKNYIKSNNITINNIEKFIYKIEENTKIIPINAKVKYGENVNTYIVNTYIINASVIQKTFVIRLNNKNETFSLEFTDNNNVDNNDSDIESNDYNHFEIQIATDEQIARNYLDQYKVLAQMAPQILYNNYLDENYKELRFGTLENFEKYLKDNAEELGKIRINKYLYKELDDNKKEYICKDQYDNVYIFDLNSIFDYKLKLDNYTILTDKFKTEYQSAEESKKVQMNIDRFIQMINRHDYKSAYNYISVDLKNRYFDTEDKFRDFIKENFFEYNNVNMNEFSKYGSNLYEYNINIEDLTKDEEESKNIKMIMQLNNEFDFIISFDI